MKTKATTMKTKARITLFGLVMAIALCYANFASADTDFATGAGASASVELEFEIVIPPFVYFRVGNVGSINTLNFSPTATDMATQANTAATGGDAAGGAAVNVVLIGNGGDVTITPSNLNGGLTSGGNTISFSQITTTSGAITAPTLTDAGGAGVPITSGAFGITNLTDVWTYEYINPATPPAVGTYVDTVTYTAALP